MKKIKQPFYAMQRWYLKLFRNVLCAVVILLVTILGLLHLPPVQQRLLSSLCTYLHQTTHYQIKCDALRLTWLRQVKLAGVEVRDPQGNPLFSIHLCKGKLNLLDLCLLGSNIIHSLSVVGGVVHLEKHVEQGLNISTFYTKVILPFIPATNTDLSIDTIQLNGINLYYHNPIKQQTISVKNIALGISHFRSFADHHSGYLTTLSYQEIDGIPLSLKNLMTQFTIGYHSIMLKNCHLVTKYSNLQGDFTLKHNKQFSIFADQENIELDAVLHTTVLSSIELSTFSDFFKGPHILYKLDGVFSLSPQAMKWQNCQLVFGALNSCIQSTGSYDGVHADFLVKTAKVYMDDLPKKPSVYFNKLGLRYVDITNAAFVGNTQKARLTGQITTNRLPASVIGDELFLGEAELNSPAHANALRLFQEHRKASTAKWPLAIELLKRSNLGAIQIDLNLHHLGKPHQDVTGYLTLHRVAIDAILPILPIRSLSGRVDLKVQGNHLNKLEVVAHLTDIKTSGYSYKAVEASCIMANARATFQLHSKDPSAKLALAGSYHMAGEQSLKAHGTIEQAHLEKLGIVANPLLVGTHFSLKIKNILNKSPRGAVILNRCTLQGLEKKVVCKQLAINLQEQGGQELLTLTSPLIDCSVQGLFTISDLFEHIKYLIKRFKNPVEQIAIPAPFHLDYAINCKKVWPILNWFSNDSYIASATTFSGHFAYDTDYHFSLDLPMASSLCFKKCNMENVTIKLNMSHLMNGKKRLVELAISSDKQDWHQLFQTDRLSLQFFMDKHNFTFSKKLSNHDNHLSIACSGLLMDQAVYIDLLPSRLTTKGKIWAIAMERTSCISKAAIAIGNVSITSGQESICIGGTLTQSATKDPLHCTIDHLVLDYASPAGPCKGIIDTSLVAHLRKGQIIATGLLSLKDATIKDYTVGTFSTKVDCNLLENKLVLEGSLQKAEQQLLKLNGSYHFMQPADSLAITTIFNQMDLDLLNLFFASVCSDITGKLSGQFQLTGSLNAPKVNGKGIIDKGKLTINYLNTSYQANGKIKLQDNYLYVKQLHLRDGRSGHAHLSGYIAMQNSFPVMLSGRMATFHLLHTTRMDNADFYGDLYASGALQMEGSIYDLLLKMQITADKGLCTIVAHDKENLDNTTKLVQFVYNKERKEQPYRVAKDENDSAIKLVLDLVILPTIKTQVVFGSSHNDMNDILQGQGTGTIQLEVGTNRKPYVMGNYLFQSGTYTVSVYSLIQKTFTIAANSQVNFNGYPQEGIAHIEACYRQTASIAELYPQTNDKRPIPVEICLSAYGRLAHPHIAYQLFFPVKSMDFELNSALEACASKALLDKNYLNKQILSLLIAKRIYNEQAIDRGDALRNSINDLLSQRIQNLVSKIKDNLEIETDLGINQSKDEEENMFQKTKIKISYLLLSERLKLSSTLGRYSRFINDWEIAYRVTKAYNMHAKLYQQPLQSKDANLALFGISFAYTKKFW
ncbi:translocation/assembly module TamB domain-containing protein [Candidatus Cardinium sp. cBcalN2]|uniref:translocation/assembly module TamB domain-containing protein n=1 Tax=Candidatus Cardinium sp. cBcalN2 TaxID=2699436 RepID=UPI001FB35957|nr:translocation/assembly module TamB domain-containing protein [Candidatus Cardinium sp. cBcalN2]